MNDAPALFSLGDPLITAAGTQVETPVTELGGMAGASVQIRFEPQGSPGSKVEAYVQGSGDQGATWHDLACAAFTAAGTALFTLAQGAAAAPVAFTDGSLADNTALNSGVVPLFDRLRIKIISTGTWGAGSLLSGRAQVR